jgi:hypothetical protein
MAELAAGYDRLLAPVAQPRDLEPELELAQAA